jgi:3-hydroxy-9,10-secoandrosta-1,3,5(10)-triene-9,17-dione monooxygenase
LPFGLVFPACIGSPAIGVALGAVAAFREQTTTRISPRDQSRVAENPFAQLALAEAAAEVTAARDRLLGNFAEAMRLAREGTEIPLAERARYRWDTAKATDRSVRAVDRLFEASGGRAVYLNNPIQRAWRDAHAIRAHAGNNLEKAAAVFGRSEFGLPPVDLVF